MVKQLQNYKLIQHKNAQIISRAIPILAFVISRALALVSEGLANLSSYGSGIEPMEDTLVTILNPLLHVCTSFFIFFIFIMLKWSFIIHGR